MEPSELRATLEAILFVSNEPVKLEDFSASFPEEGEDAILQQLDEIRKTYDETVGGFMLEQAAGGWRFATRPEHDAVLKKYFAKKGENRLSIAALETLAIIAYRQPITAPEISDIRGVNSTGVLRTLLERRMVRVSGRKNVVGSPFLYRTTREFLVHFGLNDIRDLPKLEEFGDLIGENINEDLVTAIQNAPETAPGDEIVGEVPAEEAMRSISGVEGEAASAAAPASTDGEAAENGGSVAEDEAPSDAAHRVVPDGATEEEESKPSESLHDSAEEQLESNDDDHDGA